MNNLNEKQCKTCGEVKPLFEFPIHHGELRRTQCKSCWSTNHKEIYYRDHAQTLSNRKQYCQDNKSLIKAINDKWDASHPEFIAFYVKECNRHLKMEVLLAYGAECFCCQETDFYFLTLDHKNNDGAAHKKERKNTSLYRWAKKNDYPEILQVSCWNCNSGRAVNGGICPHKSEPELCR